MVSGGGYLKIVVALRAISPSPICNSRATIRRSTACVSEATSHIWARYSSWTCYEVASITQHMSAIVIEENTRLRIHWSKHSASREISCLPLNWNIVRKCIHHNCTRWPWYGGRSWIRYFTFCHYHPKSLVYKVVEVFTRYESRSEKRFGRAGESSYSDRISSSDPGANVADFNLAKGGRPHQIHGPQN